VRDIWGERAHPDRLVDYLPSLFSSKSLVDIFLEVISPTWRNDRMGINGISKRLDRFYINVDFLGSLNRCRSWVINTLLFITILFVFNLIILSKGPISASNLIMLGGMDPLGK